MHRWKFSDNGNMPEKEWILALKAAIVGKANGVLVFAEVCLDSSRAWNGLKEYFNDP